MKGGEWSEPLKCNVAVMNEAADRTERLRMRKKKELQKT